MSILRLVRLLFILSVMISSLHAMGAETRTDGEPMRSTAEYGYLLISLGQSEASIANIHRLELRNTTTRDVKLLSFVDDKASTKSPIDFDTQTGRGNVFVLKLSPGRYEIFRFLSLANSAKGSMKFGPKQEFSIPLQIEPGKVTYAGEYINRVHVPPHDGTSRNIVFVYFVVSDQQVRDLAIARQRGDFALDLPVTNAFPDTAKVGNAFIRNAPLTDAEFAQR
jgi:hypothetical protein